MSWIKDNLLSLISITLVFLGALLAFVQWIAANKIKRAEFISQIIDKLRFDKNLSETMYIIDYSAKWYNDNFHNNNDGLEHSIDKLLSYLSYVCYLRENKIIKKREFTILQYEINRVCHSHDIQSYLWNLYHFSKANNTTCTHNYLIKYGIRNKLIKRNFKDRCNKSFLKLLNF